MLNGTQLLSGDPALKLDRPYYAHPSIQISAISIGEFQWVYLPLPLCIGNTIKEIVIYYNNTSAKSYITQTRLTWQTLPNEAHVVFDDATHRNSLVPTSYKVVTNLGVNGSMALMLRLNFANTSDLIIIGAIGIVYQ